MPTPGTRRRTSRRLDPLSPLAVFVAFYFLEFVGAYWFVLTRAAQDVPATLPLNTDVDDMTVAFVLSLAYAAAWIVGYALPLRLRARPEVDARRGRRRLTWGSLYGVACAAVVAVLVLYQFHPARGAQFRSSLTTGGYGMVFFLAITALLSVLQYASVRTVSTEYGRRLPHVRSVLLAGLLVAATASLWQLGGRGRAALPLLSFVVIYHYTRRRWSPTRAVAIALPALALLVAIPLQSGGGSRESIVEQFWSIEDHREFDSLYNLAALKSAMDRGDVGRSNGTTLLCDVQSDLPVEVRSCVNSRTILMHDIYGFTTDEVGFPISKPGEFYLAFGAVGMCALALLLGRICRWLYVSMVLHRRAGPVSVPIYFTVLWIGGWASPAKYFFQELVLLSVAVAALWLVAVALDGRRPFAGRRSRARSAPVVTLPPVAATATR